MLRRTTGRSAGRSAPSGNGPLKQRLLRLLKTLAYSEGKVRLSSGKSSTYYINAKAVTLHPEGNWLVATLFLDMVGRERFAAVGGPTLGADPIVGAMAALSFARRRPLAALIVRKEAKAHGAGRQVEGPRLARGARVLAVGDDRLPIAQPLYRRGLLIQTWGSILLRLSLLC